MLERRPVAVTGLSVLTALGRGPEAQLTGLPAFAEVRRFDTSARRVRYAALAAETGTLEEELDLAIATACAQAGVDRSTTTLLLAMHAPPVCDFGAARVYTSACVSGSTALADAAALISSGRAERIVVAGAYLVEPYQFALFDAGRALTFDNVVRPFSAQRQGTLLGDGVAAVVLEAGDGLARLAGWGRAGDAHHPCQPAPDGRGLAVALQRALARAEVAPDAVGYVNANATGTVFSDQAEAAAINAVFATSPPVSSTKGLHGHALEASGVVEFVVTVQALLDGKLPVNAGFLAKDPHCAVDLILDAPRPLQSPVAVSLNSAFGGANTALVVTV
ncbi:beta-ketoacyl-[acyl-carrier-protein] synthase family protein [Kribbella sandramycini]|uniref:3-oxoacyl-(Acyl-carrier-protein) synthase n=1 Tax=Kribbella sandramycini TaxID=60450 RepID=A0A7Y4P1N8_9ACTN|nr:beta-ketoacyl synthase N-terminal-like domain-containing protein [Kribbella sandramycini]MBB6564600.1 3-oxoacyl-(acyl-carrier-protein) synthase [Kribbella sandramycini]NOL42304.1 beta-ketoacyl-[acyl-carrier-protein] synthase family protein [Kribbella sandramycini]